MRARLDVLAAFVVGLGSLSHCLAPTEIELWLSTDVRCPAVATNGVELGVGLPGADVSDTKLMTACSSDGGLGSVVLVPSAGLGDRVGITVVLGASEPVEQCGMDASGCIIARRELPFAPHTPLILPIALEADCIGKVCDPNSTCVSGGCVEAGVVCSGSSCDLPDAAALDSGACLGTTPTQVSMTPAAQATPRVVKFGGTYTVVYASTDGNVHAVPFTLQGDSVLPGTDMVLAADAGASDMGPAATDGTSYAFAFTTTGKLATFDLTNASGKLLNYVASGPPAHTAAEGMFNEPDAGIFVTLFSEGTQYVDVETLSAMASSPSAQTPSGNYVGLTSLASSAGTYYLGATTLSGCVAYSTTWTGSGFGPLAPILSLPSCTSIKVAASGAFVAEAYYDPSVTPHLALNASTVLPFANVSSPDAYVAFGTSAGIDVVLLGGAGAIQLASFTPSTMQAPPLVTVGTITSKVPFSAASFDVVPDEAMTLASFGLVYWDGGVIRFVHVCP